MEKISNAPAETTMDIEDNDEISAEKPEFVKKIEGFDVQKLTPENIDFMNSKIQEVFRENFPIDSELIDQIPDRMNLMSSEEFAHFYRAEKLDSDEDLGFYSVKHNKILVNLEKHKTPGALFSTMFHESLHFASIQSGGGFHGDFIFPDPGEDAEAAEMMANLDRGVLTAVEGTTQLITQSYVLDYMGFTPQEQMMSYEPECQVMGTIWKPFSRDERLEAYFKTPMELLRIRVEDTFADDYDVDKPTGIFADCLMNIGIAAKNVDEALESWYRDRNPEPVEGVLTSVKHAVGAFLVRELKEGKRKLDDGEAEHLGEYLEPYTTLSEDEG